MKACRVCGVPLAPGNHSPSQFTHRNYICHVCKGEQNKRFRRGRRSIIDATTRWRAAHPEKVREYKTIAWKRWRANPANLPKLRAKWKVEKAVKRGALVRPAACPVCGKVGRIQAHHPDYSKPLDVMWLCQGCHLIQHRAEHA